VIAAAVAGAALGSKLLFWFEDPELTWHNLHNLAYFVGGKTIVGALVFGLISVELMKRYIGVHQSTGDLYAIPLALGIAIGRIGCFLTGLADNTYGTPTKLPWAINFGDGIPRHPTQLYEIAFLLFLVPILYRILRQEPPQPMWGQPPSAVQSSAARQLSSPDRTVRRTTVRLDPSLRSAQRTSSVFLPGDAFKVFMVAYLFFRLPCDFIKPYPRIFLGLGGIQWACLFALLYYSRDIVRWLCSGSTVATSRA
jgi:phosphatidylglycerol:prolipoprotein diacylglycerol transferase